MLHRHKFQNEVFIKLNISIHWAFNNQTGFVMMTSRNENIFGVTGRLCGEFTGHRFSLICSNSWANNGDVDALRRHHAHYDVIVMYFHQCVIHFVPMNHKIVTKTTQYCISISHNANNWNLHWIYLAYLFELCGHNIVIAKRIVTEWLVIIYASVNWVVSASVDS